MVGQGVGQDRIGYSVGRGWGRIGQDSSLCSHLIRIRPLEILIAGSASNTETMKRK
jgi:hypothetical protein